MTSRLINAGEHCQSLDIEKLLLARECEVWSARGMLKDRMHLDLEAQPLEQAVQIQLPPRSVVLLWSSISEPASQITVRIWKRFIPQLKLVSNVAPIGPVHAIEKGERVLSMASWARVGPLDLVEKRGAGDAAYR